jgi:hypothetical protein
MIVNPQFFNYRLIIGSLVITIVSLSVFSYLSYSKLKVNQEFIAQENKLVENELSEMISSYELVVVENIKTNVELEKTKEKINSILDSVKMLKPSEPLISSNEKKIEVFEAENKQISAVVNDLKLESRILNTEPNVKSNTLTILTPKNKELNTKTLPNATLAITDFTVEAVKRINTSGKAIKTRYANNAKQIHICFTLQDNVLVNSGDKDLYIQILNPRNNIIADKGAVNFGKSSLIYTKKIDVDYDNKSKRICSFIKTDANETLVKGTYFVSVYHEALSLGSTSIELK